MSEFLLQTLVWTGTLIALVMVLRRPVARHFGPRAAYALWMLPALRLAMPPLVLPAWLGPASEPAAAYGPVATGPASLAYEQVAPDIVLPAVDRVPLFDLADIATGLWLAGAALFLVRRFALYFRMRAELLEGARPVGEAGGVRLVETDAIAGPLAFGVIDKVIALPEGFMATRDRRTRDLAIAHEFAHHRGRDLLVNVLVQPLFALHWFNPLGWIGWTALRRDQEAACDARVVARSDAAERAAYANVIAAFATTARSAPRPALAAPMACPVLGDKSIIHRLRSLTMSEISRRRRIASRALLLGGALALPLTASITYAETSVQEAQDPAPPAPPATPAVPEVPDAPQPPAPPEAPELDAETQRELAEMERELADIAGPVAQVERESVNDGQRRVLRVRRTGEPGEIRHDVERTERRIIVRDRDGPTWDRSKFAADMARMRERGIDFDADQIREQVERALESAPRVVMACPEGQRQTMQMKLDGDGREVMYVCQKAGFSMARTSILAARNAVARDRSLSEKARAEALSAMDQALAEVEASRLEQGES